MAEQPANININDMLSPDDMKKLTELLGNNSVLLDKGKGKGKGKGKMTPQAKNHLLSQLSSHQKIQENHKPLKDMTDSEKKIYRDELKKRLHNKQDMFKQMRSNQNLLQKQMDLKIKKSTENMSKEDIGKALQMAQPVVKQEEVETEETNEKVETEEINEKLDDFLNE